MRPIWPAVVLLSLLVVLAAGHAVAERALRLGPTQDWRSPSGVLHRTRGFSGPIGGDSSVIGDGHILIRTGPVYVNNFAPTSAATRQLGLVRMTQIHSGPLRDKLGYHYRLQFADGSEQRYPGSLPDHVDAVLHQTFDALFR